MAVVVKDVKNFPQDAPTELLFDKNKDFIEKYGKKDEETYYEFVMAEFLRINGVYWSKTALYLLGDTKISDAKTLETKEVHNIHTVVYKNVSSFCGFTIFSLFKLQIMDFLESCKCDINGGYGPANRHDSHLLYTLSAIQIAAERNTMDQLDTKRIVDYIKSLQQEDGSFIGR